MSLRLCRALLRRTTRLTPWCFEKPDEVPHCVVAVKRMTKGELIVNFVAVAPSLANLRQIARLFEVADDRRSRSFGDTDRGRDVSEPCGRIAGDALENVGVVGQEPPEMIAFS
jgi:hypothetical protein